MPTVKNLAIGFGVFVGYMVAYSYVVRPAAVKFAVPILKNV